MRSFSVFSFAESSRRGLGRNIIESLKFLLSPRLLSVLSVAFVYYIAKLQK